MAKIYFGLLVIISLFSCSTQHYADLAIINANVYTVDEQNPNSHAIAIQNGRIIALGESVDALINEQTTVLDLDSAFVMPGFIESHGHFSGLGKSMQNLNFMNSKSWQEIVSMVKTKVETAEKGEWIYGRGWHQEKWDQAPSRTVGDYPDHYSLSQISADNPVILIHASGHSLFANKKAMDIAGVTKESLVPDGGAIIKNNEGEPIGVFEENAMALIKEAYGEYLSNLDQNQLDSIWFKSIELAQEECLSKGITSFQDAGSKYYELDRYEQLAKDNKFDLRLWAMVRHSSDEMEGQLSNYRKINVGNHFYTCRAVKSELDGALGAHGAWLHNSYADKDNFHGQNTTTLEELKKIAKMTYDADMQLCVHSIGDKANHETLDIFEDYAKQSDTLLRWRVEHAQHLLPEDIKRFKPLGVIASMQAIHCTSDAPFVLKRLGFKRAFEGAYIWRDLLDNGAIIANGTDAPVEDVDPLPCLFASITRMRMDNNLEFFPEKAMTRAEAIRSYTLDAAYAAFEENIKGSLEVGKLADIVVLDTDLTQCDIKQIPAAEVLFTIVGGEIKFERR